MPATNPNTATPISEASVVPVATLAKTAVDAPVNIIKTPFLFFVVGVAYRDLSTFAEKLGLEILI